MSLLSRSRAVIHGLALSLLMASPAAAQQRPAGAELATRVRLQDELARLERDGDKGSGEGLAALIRSRLERGDFEAGDQILLLVDGEQTLSDTFAVAPGPMGPVLELPQVGGVPLDGVLRSELEARVQSYLARYLRNPVVRVRPLLRVVVEGDVARPGFYAASPQQPLSDVINAAGGLTQRAKTSAIRVARGDETIWSGAALQQALGRGYSLDQLNLRAGDRLIVPGRSDSERAFRIVAIALTIPAAIYSITRMF
jgi:protein involved in polysaccharide export with SLBB domain